MLAGATRLKDVQVGQIREVLDQATKLEQQGKDVIHLEIGEPDFDTPKEIVDAAIEALNRGEVHYTSNRGLLPLREAIAEKLKKDNDITADPESEILVTAGAAEAIYLAIMAHCNPGDEVLIVEPTFLSYRQLALIAGAKPIGIPTFEKDDWVVDPDRILKAVTPKTNMIILNSPNNPTGAVLPPDVLEKIAAIAIEHDLLVLSDEIYEKIIFSEQKHHSIASLPGMKERTLTINGFSKAYAMTGWRIGYIAAAQELMLPMVKLHQYTVTCISTFSQYAAITALKDGEPSVKRMTEEYEKRKNLVVEALNDIEGLTCSVPNGSFYAFPNIKAFGMSSQEFANSVLHETGVALVPGHIFSPYGEGYVRLSFATSEEQLQEAFKRLKAFSEKMLKT